MLDLDVRPLAKVTHRTVLVTMLISGNHPEQIQLFLIPSSSALVILGSPWLVRHHLQIDWSIGSLTGWSVTCDSLCLHSALLYNLSRLEQQVMESESPALGLVRPSSSPPVGAGFFFEKKKKDGLLRPRIDYRVSQRNHHEEQIPPAAPGRCVRTSSPGAHSPSWTRETPTISSASIKETNGRRRLTHRWATLSTL